MKGLVTAKDVADRAGASISTVGRVINDDPRISAETKDRVLRIAAEMGYVQSMPARVMRGGSSRLVGLVLPNIRNDFYSAIAQALSMCCETADYRLVLVITDDNRDVEAKQIRELIAARAAGVCIVPTASPRRETTTMLKSIPHVQLLRRSSGLEANWFGIDDENCIREATAHLLSFGHRHIAYVGGNETLSTGADRLKGYKRAFAEAGLTTDDTLIELGARTNDYGMQAVDQLLKRKVRPTAVVCGSAEITVGVMGALRSHEISIPEELSLIGFGDPPWAKWWGPGLTSIRFSINELATACGLWFLHRLKNPKMELAPHSSITSSILVMRGSTGSAPARASSTSHTRSSAQRRATS